MADGDSAAGTHYRYIATGGYPYFLQCYRGDISQTKIHGVDLELDLVCNVNDLGPDGDCILINQEMGSILRTSISRLKKFIKLAVPAKFPQN